MPHLATLPMYKRELEALLAYRQEDKESEAKTKGRTTRSRDKTTQGHQVSSRNAVATTIDLAMDALQTRIEELEKQLTGATQAIKDNDGELAMVSAERERAVGEAHIACEVAEALRSRVGA